MEKNNFSSATTNLQTKHNMKKNKEKKVIYGIAWDVKNSYPNILMLKKI